MKPQSRGGGSALEMCVFFLSFVRKRGIFFEAHATSRYLCLILLFEHADVHVVNIVVKCFAFYAPQPK